MLPCGVIHLCFYLCQFSTRLWGQGSGSESSCSSGGVSKNSPLVKRLQVRWLIGCKEKLQGERLLAPWPFTVSLFSLGRVPTTPVNPQRILLTFWLDPTVRSLPAGRRGLCESAYLEATIMPIYLSLLGFPDGSVVKNPPAMQETHVGDAIS